MLEFVRKGSDIDTPLSVSKGSTEYYHLDGIVHLDYARRFGRHSVSAMGYMLYQSLSQQYTGSGITKDSTPDSKPLTDTTTAIW